MKKEKVLDLFKKAGALHEGHFILSSGLRSSIYLQCALIMADPKSAAKACKALAAKVQDEIKKPIDLVVSPAMGGVVVGYEMARQLKVPGIFCERVEGEFQFRRGFEIPPKANVLMVEDVVTTGLSSKECIQAIKEAGGRVVGGACLIDRSNGKAKIGAKLVPLARIEAPTYQPDKLPPELESIPAIKPGSRGLK